MAKPTWLALSTTSGSGDNSFNVKAAKHTGRVDRSGSITVQGTGVSGSKVINVSQDATPEFVRFNSDTYAVNKEGGKLTITGKSNAASLRFRLSGANPRQNDVQMYFPNREDSSDTTIVEFDSEVSQRLDQVISYTAAGKKTDNGSPIADDPGASNEYDFAVQIDFAANTAYEDQWIKLEVSSGSENIFDTTTIKQAKGEAFLKVYDNAEHTGDEVTSISLGNGSVPEALAKTLYVDSNTSWTVS